ncbi:MAG TPA: 50S ribosomal protein L7 [Clostridiales bacterium]|jgi:ribosomal protein L7Ae-like RNA K-turn-binding protein|nr:50S ribosomal protein L7 [Clostridiales bacterium]
MNDLNMLGLCRRAGKLSPGHDAVKMSIRSGRAKLILITSDASDRLKKEISNLAGDIKIIFLQENIEELSLFIGRKAAVLSVDDENFAKGIISRLNQEE